MATAFQQSYRGFLGIFVALLVCNAPPAYAQPKVVDKDGSAPQSTDKDGKQAPGFFIPIAQAKDCAYDHGHHRLYVTTPKQLVVIDMKEHKVLTEIDLLGGPQGVDIAPQGKFLVVAPIGGQFIYKIKLDWKSVNEMEISRIKFKAEGNEPGVFSLGVGADDSVLFSTTFSGSGWVKLRRLNADDSVEEVGNVRMDSVVAVSGDRQTAFIGEGNISSGPLQKYDFKTKTLSKVAELQCFYYELACSRDGSRIARPYRGGCDLYDAAGSKLGNLEGTPVISAAFNPKQDSLYVMRHGELKIQEYNGDGKLLPNTYPLDKPLVIKADVHSSVVAHLQPVGRDQVMANFRRVVNVNFRAYQSARLHVSEDGQSLCAVVPAGVYLFPLEESQAPNPAPKVKIIEK